MDRSRNFGFLLKDVSRRYVARFEYRAREISLTLSQCKVLVRLEKNEGISQARLAELTEIEPMTMVRILDRMESDGWLERRPDPADRRARCLYLTKRSKPLLDEIWQLADLARADAFSGIGNSEREMFVKLLERIHRNLVALDGAPIDTLARAGATDRLDARPRTRSGKPSSEAEPRARKASSAASAAKTSPRSRS